MSKEISGISPSGTLYARVKNKAGLWWNGSSFEEFSSANYANYVIAMTEEGNSNEYVADFPAGITAGGTYTWRVHRTTGSPNEGDLVVNTGTTDWTGSASISVASGSMSGSEFYEYILRLGFKRTDKSTEVYEAITDAIQEMRRMFMFDEAEIDATSTDTITELDDFKIDVESDLGLILGVTLEDGTTGTKLIQKSKADFDDLYPSINVDTDRGYPKHFCIYAGQIYIGPAPDRTDYLYRINYSQRAGNVTAVTPGVPFTNLYRDVLADNVQMRIFRIVEEYDKSNLFKLSFEDGFLYATRRERNNSGAGTFAVKGFNL